IGVDRLWRERLAARESEQPLGQGRRALRPRHRVVDRPNYPGVRVAAQSPRRHVEIAADDGQEIVEIVSDAAGKLPDRLHLLRLAERFLDALALRDRIVDALLERLVEVAQ